MSLLQERVKKTTTSFGKDHWFTKDLTPERKAANSGGAGPFRSAQVGRSEFRLGVKSSLAHAKPSAPEAGRLGRPHLPPRGLARQSPRKRAAPPSRHLATPRPTTLASSPSGPQHAESLPARSPPQQRDRGANLRPKPWLPSSRHLPEGGRRGDAADARGGAPGEVTWPERCGLTAAVRPHGGCPDSGWHVGSDAGGAFRSRRRQPLQRPPRAGGWERSPSVSVGRGWGLGLLLTASAGFPGRPHLDPGRLGRVRPEACWDL